MSKRELLKKLMEAESSDRFLAATRRTPKAYEPKDPLFQQAAEIVQAQGRGAACDLKRILRIGHRRAAALLRELGAAGKVRRGSGGTYMVASQPQETQPHE